MEPDRDDRLVYADKIAKLLRKAENTDNPQEAEALSAKAQQLMVKYAVTEGLLALAEGRQVQDHIVEETIVYAGIFHMALFDIGRAISRANHCKHLITKGPGLRSKLHVVGFQSDVTNVKVLDASLQVQASIAMQRWYRDQDVTGHTPMQRSLMRRTFLMAFAHGLGTKLKQANRAGVDEAVKAEAERSGDNVDNVRMSTDLVLRTKKERVDDWIDQTYGNSLRSARRNYSTSGYRAQAAGYQAGMQADLGDPRVGGSRRQIGR